MYKHVLTYPIYPKINIQQIRNFGKFRDFHQKSEFL